MALFTTAAPSSTSRSAGWVAGTCDGRLATRQSAAATAAARRTGSQGVDLAGSAIFQLGTEPEWVTLNTVFRTLAASCSKLGDARLDHLWQGSNGRPSGPGATVRTNAFVFKCDAS